MEYWWQWGLMVAFGLPLFVGLIVSFWWGLALLIVEFRHWVEGGME